MITLSERKDVALRGRGLTEAEASDSREKYGQNKLSAAKRISFFRRFLSNLGDPVIKILLAALAINLLFLIRGGDIYETVGIGISVLLATLISTLSEHGSENAFAKLHEDSDGQECRVMRDGRLRSLSSEDIVVGDLILLGAGERVPADCVLVSGELRVDQAIMTGENREIKKKPVGSCKVSDALDPSIPYALLGGCLVTGGEGEAIVSVVGDKTFLGGISREIQKEKRESPLRTRLKRLAKTISVMGYIAAVLIALAYLLDSCVFDSGYHPSLILMKLSDGRYIFEKLFHSFTLGLTVIVVAVPEGLPMMIAVVLSANIRKMVKASVLVRKPMGIEAAGCMNILFTDKTGTLTEGRLSVKEYILGDGSVIEGRGGRKSPIMKRIALSGLFNTSSRLALENGKPIALGGNMTDKALIESVANYIDDFSGVQALCHVPFDSAKKYSAVKIGGKERGFFIKGAAELLLPHVCAYLDKNGEERFFSPSKFEKIIKEMAVEGDRIVLIAESDSMSLSDSRLRLIAAARISDGIRKSAAESVRRLRDAGIKVVMITGDNPDTAQHIAKECSIMGEGDICLSGSDMAKLSDMKLRELLPRIGAVARALPSDKSRLVRIAQEAGLVVGMTGDGVNDAPALRCADIGFAMGSGTQVAKEAGDIIILDSDLASIANAVLYGRSIFKHIRKFITLQLTMNLSAVGISMIGPFIGFEAPVTVVQMLWINIIMDTLGGLAFAGEAPRAEYMKEKPKRRDEPILSSYMAWRILSLGIFSILLCLIFLKAPAMTSFFRSDGSNIYLLTAFFAFYIFSSVISCFAVRTDSLNLFDGITKNKGFLIIMLLIAVIQVAFIYLGGAVLRTAPLTAIELRATLAFSLCIIPFDFLFKTVFALKGKNNSY